MKSVILTFFDSYPPKTGSGVVCVDFFNLWPSKSKKLFQFSLAKKILKILNLTHFFNNDDDNISIININAGFDETSFIIKHKFLTTI